MKMAEGIMPGCTHGDIFGFAVSTGDICFSVAFHLQIQRQEQAIYPDSSRSSSLPDRLPFFHKGSIALNLVFGSQIEGGIIFDDIPGQQRDT